MSPDPLNLPLPAEFLEAVAQRAAEILAEQQGDQVDDDGYLDVDGAARFLSCPKSRIYSLVSANRLPVHRDGSRLLFDRRELRAYVAAGGGEAPMTRALSPSCHPPAQTAWEQGSRADTQIRSTPIRDRAAREAEAES